MENLIGLTKHLYHRAKKETIKKKTSKEVFNC